MIFWTFEMSKTLWWLVQINAVIAFLSLSLLAEDFITFKGEVLIWLGLLVAALMEYIGFHSSRGDKREEKKDSLSE